MHKSIKSIIQYQIVTRSHIFYLIIETDSYKLVNLIKELDRSSPHAMRTCPDTTSQAARV